MKHLFYLFVFVFLSSCKEPIKNTKISGPVFGTTYNITYHSDINFQKQFDSLFGIINQSMSTYQADSYISKLNHNEDNLVDSHFKRVFDASKEIYKETEGAFDPTIGAVVNAWDFGPEGRIEHIDSLKIDSLMASVGFNKLALSADGNNYRIDKPKATRIDFNAIAKGYGVDVIGEFLGSKGVENYLVEIGGEIRTRGINAEKKSNWKVGVEMPHFDGSQSILKAISLHGESMATSGTYRKFKTDAEGNRYAHIIDAKTGYPSKTNLLSVSVIAENCMTADAYATAFQAMGIEKVKFFLKTHPELKVFLIFENDKKELETLTLNGFPEN